LKRLRRIINIILWVTVGLYLTVIALVHVPAVQSALGRAVASAVSKKLGTAVSVGRVDVGLFNRIIIDDVAMLDQRGKHMLWTSRLSAKFSYTDLVQGRVTITSAQIFTPKFNFYKENASTKPNFQFVLDSLASKDKSQKSHLNLAINSLIIRHGQMTWNRLDKPVIKTFDVNHLNVSNISSHIIFSITDGDNYNVYLKRLSLREASGLDLRALSFKAKATKQSASLDNFYLELPRSEINIPHAETVMKNGKRTFNAALALSRVNLADLRAFVPDFAAIARPLLVRASVSGVGKRISISQLDLSMPQYAGYNSFVKPSDLRLSAVGGLVLGKPLRWHAVVRQFHANANVVKYFAGKVPEPVMRLGNIAFRGSASGRGGDLMAKGELHTGAGNAVLDVRKAGSRIGGHIATKGFSLGTMLANPHFGMLVADLDGSGDIKAKQFSAKGLVSRFDYNNYIYRNISLDGSYVGGMAEGRVSIDDPNISLTAEGGASLLGAEKTVHLKATVAHFLPSALNMLKGRLANATYGGTVDANFRGRDINTTDGYLRVGNFSMKQGDDTYSLDSLNFRAGHSSRGHYLLMHSGFGSAAVYGKFDYAALPQAIENVIVKKLPGITNLAPFRYRPIHAGEVSFAARLTDSKWARPFLNVPLDILDTVNVRATFGRDGSSLDADLSAPDIVYGDRHLKNIRTTVRTIDGILSVEAALTNMRTETLGTDLGLQASAGNDHITANVSLDNHAAFQRLRGTLSSEVAFRKDMEGKTLALLNFNQSQVHIGDSLYTVHPSTVLYSKNHLEVHDFLISGGTQRILVSGTGSNNDRDSLTATLKNVNVNYILNLVNFHSVEFGGAASGTASVKGLFSSPDVNGSLRVDNFKLIQGRLGTLYANVGWKLSEGQINIDGITNDTIREGKTTIPSHTVVNGYVSIKHHYIDLGMKLDNSRAEFLGTLASSFLSDVDLRGNGDLRLWGDLSKLNLTGDITTDGAMTIKPTGVRYYVNGGKVHFIENEIQLVDDPIRDAYGNQGIVSGAIHHQHISHITADISARANHLLAYNLDGSDGSSFYGKVFGTGDVTVKSRPGTLDVNVNVTPTKGSEVVYDITSTTAPDAQDFVHWHDRNASASRPDSINRLPADSIPDIPTDIHLSLLINANPSATLRLITDKATGDYITLNGAGTLRATYFNKGGLDIFGTYTVERGIYSLTIQNIIKKIFTFSQGGTITFGGDPYAAILKLRALYSIASVSLSDLQMGKSFSSNNVKVNCIMDITGTPANPQVSFDLDFPTMSSDTKQMISSIINGQEEMNQQVLYLLAVGRFYSRGTNNASTQTNQTSLAMQSILSGQLSQQINNVIGGLMKNSNWNFGANISTGDEGFNNAEYEGLFSGNLLNNRLVFNGQIGYRDNANATTSFIGDFDLRYLIFPNGNFSVHVYNQANDRYFTRNSLNTQGVGFILKKDFGSLRDLFSFGRSKATLKNKEERKKRK